MHRSFFFLGFFLLCLSNLFFPNPVFTLFEDPVFAEDRTKVLSFKDKGMQVYRQSGFVFDDSGKLKMIPKFFNIPDSVYDLYLDFSGEDYTENYRVLYKKYEKNTLSKISGDASAKFISPKDFILLFPTKNSILQHQTSSLQAFTISFGLLPYHMGEGNQTIAEYLYNSESVFENNKHTEHGLRISIEKGVIHYHFINFFQDEYKTQYSFTIKEYDPLISNKWEFHSVIVDPSSKTIRSLRNDKENEVQIITDNGQIFGKQLLPSHMLVKQKKSFPLIIGKNGLFSLDKFIIYRDVVTDHILYQPHKLHFLETAVFEISDKPSFLQKMELETSDPEDENYRIAYRIDNKYFLPSTPSSLKYWVYIDLNKNNFPPSQSSGKYLQWRVEYRDPEISTEKESALKDIILKFREHPNPGPVKISGVNAGDGFIEVRWQSLPNPTVSSYEIYYGTSSKNYFGKSLTNPESPISIPIESSDNIKEMIYIINGLENEKEYFISVRTKNIHGQFGPFSEEIHSKPSSTKNSLGYSIER